MKTLYSSILPRSISDINTRLTKGGQTSGRSTTRASRAARFSGIVGFLVFAAAVFYSASSASPVASPPFAETVTVFASDCATPSSSFSLGDTVCAKVAGAPAGKRKLVVSTSYGAIVESVDITSDPQTFSFTLPSTASSPVGDTTGDNRGSWRVLLLDSSEPVIIAAASFVVHDPAQVVADLVVYKFLSTAETELDVNGNLTTTMYVANRGPDTATNVHVTEVVPTDTTFVSLVQDSGPTFTVSTPGVGGQGTITCDIASLAPGNPAIFTLVYKITAVTSSVSIEANITSTTTDRDTTDNSSTPIAPTTTPSGGGAPACTITCPPNSVQDSDSGQSGAIVSYASPTTSGSCGAVVCSPASGSFFPIGTTPVSCDDPSGNSCGFSVTVNDATQILITLNGDNPMTVECHGTFTDPFATAKKGGVSLTVTSQVNCCDESDPPVCNPCSVNPNAPGSYTITYTATDGTDTATATRTVNVVDSTPPTITLIGSSPMTVECHSSFVDPGATANDACAASVAVTASGTVDPNTPGTYAITYEASDSSGNEATPVTRTVNVVDTMPPVITINGANPATVECHTSYTDAGATASDACVGSVAVTSSGSVNVNVPGTYTITYSASDGARTATSTRTVNVVDTIPPTITCQADIVADFDPAVGGAVVTYTAPVGVDNCGATTTQIAGLPSGSTFPLGTTVNTFRVTDGAGLTASCSFNVTVALTSIIGLDSVSITGSGLVDSYDSTGGYPATKTSLANVLSNGTITLSNSGKVFGNVRSTRANVVMSGASQVTGNATAGTTVSLSGSAIVSGTTTNNQLAPVMSLPAVPACGPPYSSSSGISGTFTYNSSTGDLTLGGVNIATLANGTYCFHNLTLTNSAQLKVNGLVVIKLTGTLNAGGASIINNTTGIPSNLRILSSFTGANGVVLGNSANSQLVIYAPGTSVSISGAAPLFGTVIGKSVTISTSGMVHYDIRLKSIWPALWPVILGQ